MRSSNGGRSLRTTFGSEVSEIVLRSCPEAGRMERGLKARSARARPERQLAGHATAGLEASVGQGGRRSGACGSGVKRGQTG